MARIGVLALLVTGPLLLGAGEGSRILALSPDNAEAQALGPLTAYIEGNGESRLVWLKLRDGQVLKGKFEVIVGGSFGALGKARGLDRPGRAYTGDGAPILHGRPTYIDMKSPNGTAVHCEVMHDSTTDHGSGICLFQSGAEYHVLY
jgi:hypothetical protein